MYTSFLSTVVTYRMAGNFGGANFRGKSEKVLRINFCGLKLILVTAIQSIRARRGANNNVIDTRSRFRSISSVTETLLQRNLDK
jgi:hypothetical protein